MLDLRQIQYFVCLYEERSATRAARRLNVVQPALSMQITRIENRLGFQLFERTARGMIPTAAGEAVYKILLPILLDLKQADQQIMEMNGKVLGKLAVGIIPSITNSILAEVLSRFSGEYPHVDIRIDEAYSGTLIEWVAEGDLDFAIVNSTRRRAGIAMQPLIEEELVFLQRRSQNRRKDPIAFKQIKDQSLVLPSHRHAIRHIVDEAAAKQGIRIAPRIEVDALGPTLKLVSESHLTTVLPAIIARKSANELPLEVRRIIAPTLKRQLVYVYRSQRPLSRVLQAFVGSLEKEIRRQASDPTKSPRSDRVSRERRKLSPPN